MGCLRGKGGGVGGPTTDRTTRGDTGVSPEDSTEGRRVGGSGHEGSGIGVVARHGTKESMTARVA